MIKLVYCIRKKEGLSSSEFENYWREVHGPKVKAHAASINAVRYVQSHQRMPTLNDAFRQSRNLAEPYDGVTELWWETEEDLMRALASPEGQKAAALLIEDESKFIDFSRSCMFLTEEIEIF